MNAGVTDFCQRIIRKRMASPIFNKNQACEKHVYFPRRMPPVRPWVKTSEPIVSGQNKLDFFSLATYNLLAQSLLEQHTMELYQHCPPQFLAWEYRKQGLLALLTGCYADILCLQEVEEIHYEDTFLPYLRHHGFDGVYLKRTGTYTDGCAIFYRCALFELVDFKKVQYFNSDKCPILNRHNVGLIVKLRARGQEKHGLDFKRQLCVATTHLLFNPKAGEVKLAQLALLLAELHRMCQTPDGGLCAAVLCGDFNCLPNCPLQLFIINSKLQYEGLCAAEIAGFSRKRNRLIPVPLLSPRLGIADNCTFVPLDQTEKSISDGKLQSPSHSGRQDKRSVDLTNEPKSKTPMIDVTVDNGSIIDPTSDNSAARSTTEKEAVTPATLSHGFKFESVYKVVKGVQPASVTTFHCSAMEMVDYIYFTPASVVQSHNFSSLQLLARCALPSTSTLMELGPLPNEFLPSDHLHLQAQFQLLTH